MKKHFLLLAFCALQPAVSNAEGMGVSAKLGTLGVGVDLTREFSENVTGRIGINAFSYTMNGVQGGNNFNAKLQLQSVDVLADYYPFDGAFRASVGALYNNNKFTGNALPSAGGTFNLNGVATALNSLTANVTFNSLAPYLGIGWGNPVAKGKGWGFVADLGVLFQGSPKVTLSASCAGGCAPAVTANVLAEQARVQSSLNKFRYYPVASIGASYQF